MSAARILGSAYPVLLLLALLVVAVVGGVLAVRKERRDPSSYELPEPSGDLAWWALLSAGEQEAFDAEVIEATAAAEDDARAAAEHLAHRVRINTLTHP